MGVQGLWELLAPVGRRVSVETLAGKKLAIDASIWMVQFMKAMRDEKGEMVRNAHLLGFFRRICKLLFLRTKPVFVFDGGTPALKRRTVAARRRHRENARAKIRKTAEKLLLNHLKAKKLEELAEEIKNNRVKDDSKGKQVKDDSKGKQVRMSNVDTDLVGSSSGEPRTKAGDASNQESLDELLAASLAAEEERKFTNYEEEDDGDEDEEMIFQVTSGNIDPTVLASLPPSMQLDLLVQMRERLMAENRQKYQKIKKVPTKFSELQIQSYLKTVAFRREIDEVQKCAAGRGLGGVQTSRIASEANREFIFSSSFTGDKQMLTTVQKNGDNDHHALKNKPVISDLLKHKSSTSPSKSATDACIGELAKNFGQDVETYCDERGRVRVSRVRGLGMRMTRDLQRNLDLMKEYEEEKEGGDISADPETICNKVVSDDPKCLSEINHPASASISKDVINETISRNSGMLRQKERSDPFDERSMLGSAAAIEISFLEDDDGMKDTDDLFLHLVSGSSTSKLYSQNVNSEISTNDSDSEFVWEEGMVEEGKESREDNHKEIHTSLVGVHSSEEDEVDWEEGSSQLPKVSSHCRAEHEKAVLSGPLGEEADIEEAIRRSLEDFNRQKPSTIFPSDANIGISSVDQNLVGSFFISSTLENSRINTHGPLGTSLERSLSCATTDELEHDDACRKDVLQTINSLEKHLSSSTVSGVDLDVESSFKEERNGRILVSSIMDNGTVGTSHINNVPGMEPSENHFIQKEQCMDTSKQAGNEPSTRIFTEDFTEISSIMNSKTTVGAVNNVLAAAHWNDTEASESSHSFGRTYNRDSSQKSFLIEETVAQQESEQSMERENGLYTVELECFGGKNMTQDDLDNHMEVAEANLDREISLLRQERVGLGAEQIKLERNAEAVSSEMFAECQELLQIFGLPYIIAPMEAEAQCAFMEVTNLVDGVVTDDSDVFLFGARNVHKNIFDDRKYVETYLMKDIESELGLSREQLIRMALLLGSDYTEGVSGIGIVNAIEVVHAFPEENGLQKFREWIESPDPAILGKLDSNSGSKLKKRSLKASNNEADEMRTDADGFASEGSALGAIDGQPSVDCTPDIKEIFMNKHRNVSKNWHVPSSFPGESVISAYTSPLVDESTDPFSWGKPDLDLLCKLCWERFGWNIHKANELLVPVLKEYSKHETQLRLEAFYTFNERFAKIRSQRIKKAVKGIMGTCSSELMGGDLVAEGSKSGKKRRLSPSAPEECKPGISSDGKISNGRKASKPSRRQNTERRGMLAKDGAGGSQILDHGRRNAKTGSSGNVRGRGRGKGRGRGRREEPDGKSTEEGSSDDHSGRSEFEKHVKVPETTPEMRRSTRQRKHVKYSEENLEVDDVGGSSDQNDRGASGIDEGVNPCPEDSLSRGYLFSGGGFCINESNTEPDANHPAASPSRDLASKGEARVGDVRGLDEGGTPHDGRFSRDDDLFRGGGFCVDEIDTEGDAIQSADSPVNDMVNASQIAQGLDVGSSGQENLKRENSPVKACSQLEQEGEGGAANSPFSAMPLLRRKRKVGPVYR